MKKYNLKLFSFKYRKQKVEERQIIFRRRRLAVIFILSGIIMISMGTSIFQDYLKFQKLTNIQKTSLVQKKNMDKKKKELEKKVLLLSDEEYISKLARTRFQYSKNSELIYILN